MAEKGLPATKVTGKWLFPQHLVEQWVEIGAVNYPQASINAFGHRDLLVVCGSNDPLLDSAIGLYNRRYSEQAAVFGNLGSMGGLKALRRNICHIAASHLLQEDENGYNFEFADKVLDRMPAVVNFCRREQGLLVPKGNPGNITGVEDLRRPGIKIVNRALGTGTRLLLDRAMKQAGISGDQLAGYHDELAKHLDVGLAVLAGRADTGPGIRAVAGMLDIGFVPVRWERYDLMIAKERFFEENIQRFLNLLHESDFQQTAQTFAGYDMSSCGNMLFPE